ncbi:MAG: proline--tRNA ligase, partial [Candidatus Methanomethylophilus sp.]|nr:proline--tRNA ligase [Methanomethylophilus sp.]
MTDKKTDFGEWYNETVEKAQLCDKRYPIKGMNVWTPYGWKLMTQIDAYIRREMVATGHDEVCFPLLIPQTEFNKEKEHIKGFDSEVYWVTKAGNNDLGIPLLLRPTSETAMYPMFSLWIRSHTDLPLKVFQIVNTFRYETKQTRAFMRVREIHFFESHTCHETEEDAQKQVEQDMVIMDNVAKELCLPYSMLVRTEWDKFPGAYYTVGIDTVMPSGRTLQLGSIHHYRTNFSKPYNITYEDDKGEHHYVHQTTYGMSERLLGAVVGVHADDKGLILPPAIAPVQVVIVPIFSKNNRDEIMAACKVVNAALQDTGFRSKVDDRDLRPGNKFFDWEMRGVPLRLELGGRDLESQ